MTKEPGQTAYEARPIESTWLWRDLSPPSKDYWATIEAVVRADERERCARACESDFDSEMRSNGSYFAATIRNLGQS